MKVYVYMCVNYEKCEKRSMQCIHLTRGEWTDRLTYVQQVSYQVFYHA